jgi:hypothetical protein
VQSVDVELKNAVVYKPALLPQKNNEALDKSAYNHGILKLFDSENVDYKIIGYHYGGPKTLAQYRGFIDVPYQVSTMKLYENLAHGVVMLLPTVRLWCELCKVINMELKFIQSNFDLSIERYRNY